jgi:hypothetical protein
LIFLPYCPYFFQYSIDLSSLLSISFHYSTYCSYVF